MASHNSNDNNHRILQILKFLDASPNDSFLLHALALEYVKQGNLLEAKNVFERVISQDAYYLGSYYHLAKTYESLEHQAKAIQTYEEGIKIAQMQGDFKTLNELRSALDFILDGDD
jgi:tetratricopeptide (TPR) repeat protein